MKKIILIFFQIGSLSFNIKTTYGSPLPNNATVPWITKSDQNNTFFKITSLHIEPNSYEGFLKRRKVEGKVEVKSDQSKYPFVDENDGEPAIRIKDVSKIGDFGPPAIWEAFMAGCFILLLFLLIVYFGVSTCVVVIFNWLDYMTLTCLMFI